MVNEGLIDHGSAIKMVKPRHLDQILHPQFERPSSYEEKVIATGLPASPGAAVGQIVFTADDAETWHAQGEPVILVRTETSAEDVGGMHAAAGILTARGGMTFHAAVVARGWGKCCVAGCSSIHVNDTEKVVVVGNRVLREGDWLSLNGSTGGVILGKVPLSPPALSGDLGTFMSWVDELKQLKVMVNADTPADALTERNNGAEGIGFCRTEHMVPFAIILLPVTIRLLDPPLHEFLPEGSIEDMLDMLSFDIKSTNDEILARIEKLSEVNPMLGFRGCRLGISYPELTTMQALAIFEAAIAMDDHGFEVFPEIMVPLVGTPQQIQVYPKHYWVELFTVRFCFCTAQPLRMSTAATVNMGLR
ncbi:hypothetical protein PR202_ga12507 [Eleusine coracana subsp. coracana]|uniref:pyruvate, phosphate dikinase n=1 Tax=Eleusine coracana subsp. coracana TaxID=191504 RepID=A0AAV5CC35_ELECO|nr:hypothetical protein PR202_ga12507 [Eleusine coracana subsp. coracana]